MTRFIVPIILIAIAGSVFFVFANPIYSDISELKTNLASYNTALDNSVELEKERDKVVAKKNAMSTENLTRLEKFLPENVDNIRLILEIEQIAIPYGMALKNVKYNATETKTSTTGGGTLQGGKGANFQPKDYGIFDLEFSTSGTYSNFISFTKDLEKNLRLVDISSVTFSSSGIATGGLTAGVNARINSSEIYKYDFKIKTYWLKN